jgi:Ca2+-binding RTX toxin-like protein
MSTVGRSLGTNLGGIAQWSTQSPFIDQFKSARSWITQANGVWDTQEQGRLDLDANGWVRSLPSQGSGVTYDRVTTMVVPFGEAARSGRYVVMYDGQGEINYVLGSTKITNASVAGRDVVALAPAANPADQLPITLQISATNPNDYIRNIRVYHEEDLPLVELGLRYNPEFLKNIGENGTLRFMDWMNTNHITTTQEWSNRPTVDQSTWMTHGVPVEIMVELANLTGTNPWFTIPHTATDDYIRQFATYVRDHLDPKLNAYVEFSNEVWNWQFPQAGWANTQGAANLTDANGNPPEAGWVQWYGVRAAQTADLWKEVFSQRSGSPTLTTVFATQSAWHYLANVALEAPDWVEQGGRPPKESFDSYAIAPYFGHDLGAPEHLQTVLGWARSGDAGMAAAFEQMRNGGLLNSSNPLGGSIAQIKADIAAHKTNADSHGLELIAYEGGQHVVGVGNVVNNQEITDFFVRLNRDPRMGTLYQEYLDAWKQLGGGLFTNFSDVGESGKWGSWGVKERWNQEPTAKSSALDNFINTNDRWWADGSSGEKVGDFQRGQAGQDSLVGSAFNDTMLGGAGNDTLTGGTGNDYLHGEDGNDRLDGSSGNDVIMGGLGRDTLVGGNGNDQFRFSDGRQGTDVIFDFNRRSGEQDVITLVDSGFSGLQVGTLSASQYGEGATITAAAQAVRNANGQQAGAAVLAVTRGSNVEIYYDANTGTAGGEQLLAILNSQSIQRINQNQFRVVSGNSNAVNPGSTSTSSQTANVIVPTGVTLRGSSADDILRGQAANDSLSGGDGHDLIHGEAGNDSLTGGNGDDRLFAGIGDDRLFGDAGNDSLSGGEGNDALFGGEGVDRLLGEAGDDILQGGAGKDALIGGTGRDQFVFTSISELGDVISDLGAHGEFDQIILSGSDFASLNAGTLGTNQFGAVLQNWNTVQNGLYYASQNAKAANQGQDGAAILALQANFGSSVDVYYDANTSIFGNEVFIATLSAQTINTLNANQFAVRR